VDWTPLVSTAIGGAVAMGGALLADRLRHHGQRERESRAERRQCYVDFVVAIDASHSRLRQISDPAEAISDPHYEASRVFGVHHVYEAREKLLMSGSAAAVGAGERVLNRLGALRDAVGAGAQRRTAAFHDPYHEFAEALWRLRRTIREDLGASGLSPADLDKPSWDSRETCAFCRANAGRRAGDPVAESPLTI
jgi:hypothetical protein